MLFKTINHDDQNVIESHISYVGKKSVIEYFFYLNKKFYCGDYGCHDQAIFLWFFYCYENFISCNGHGKWFINFFYQKFIFKIGTKRDDH